MQATTSMPLPHRPMLHALAKSWWVLLLRGIAAIIFGVLAFAWPGLTLVTLVLLYGAFALVDGVLSLVAAVTGGAKAIPTGGSSWSVSSASRPALSHSFGPASPQFCW